MRFSPVDILVGHWKGFSNAKNGRPDWLARSILLLPVIVFVVAWCLAWQVSGGAALLAALALLTGVLVGAFTQLTNLRLRLSDMARQGADPDHHSRDALDETAAHLLMAALVTIATAVLLAVGVNLAGAGTAVKTVVTTTAAGATETVTTTASGAVTGVLAAVIIGLASYATLLLLLVLPRLYQAYVDVNHVRASKSGLARGTTRDHDEHAFLSVPQHKSQ